MNSAAMEALSQSSIMPILEFASISGVVIVTYMTMHAMFYHVKPANKMLISMFLGTVAYGIGKVILLTFLINPLFYGI